MNLSHMRKRELHELDRGMDASVPLARESGSRRSGDTALDIRVQTADRTALADGFLTVGLSLLAALVFLKYDIFQQPFPPDTTFHIYAAQQMLQGKVIYRDIGIIKAPLSDFIALLAIVVMQPFGISDLLAPRLIFWALSAAAVGMTYLAGRTFFNQRVIGILAALTMLSFQFFGVNAVAGPEPKTPVILFGLAALVLIQKRRWGWAGVCASLAALAWQPGLIVVAIVLAGALYTRAPDENPGVRVGPGAGFRHPRLRQFTRALLGVVGPAALVVLYLIANDALLAARNATIGANWVHWYTTSARIPFLQLLGRNLQTMASFSVTDCFPQQYHLVALGVLGFFGIVGVELARAVKRHGWRFDLRRTPFVLYGLGFTAFTLIDFDYCPDLIPLMPVAAIGLGWLLWQVITGLSTVWTKYAHNERTSFASNILSTLAALLIAVPASFQIASYAIPGATARDQEQVVVEAQKLLGPGDRVQELGTGLVLIHTHRTNATKLLLLGSKSGLGVVAFEPGGVGGWLKQLDGDPPKLILISRENFLPWTSEFYDWLNRRYRLVKTMDSGVTIRMFLLKD